MESLARNTQIDATHAEVIGRVRAAFGGLDLPNDVRAGLRWELSRLYTAAFSAGSDLGQRIARHALTHGSDDE